MLKYFKMIMLLGFVFIFSKNTQAQTFEAGVIAGVNLSQLHGDGLAGFNQIGLNFGGRVAVTPIDRWKWSLDILFSQKGSNRGANDPRSIGIKSYRLNYAEIPFMVHYLDWLDESAEFYKLHFTGGISVGRLVTFKVKDIDDIDISDRQDFTKNNMDLIIGATFYLNKRIGINGQYSYTVFDVRKDKKDQSLAGRTLTFRGIYMF